MRYLKSSVHVGLLSRHRLKCVTNVSVFCFPFMTNVSIDAAKLTDWSIATLILVTWTVLCPVFRNNEYLCRDLYIGHRKYFIGCLSFYGRTLEKLRVADYKHWCKKAERAGRAAQPALALGIQYWAGFVRWGTRWGSSSLVAPVYFAW